MKKIKKKVFIMDPVCVQEKGHNFAALIRYFEFIKSLGVEQVSMVSSKLLPEDIYMDNPTSNHLIRYFHHYYIHSIPVSSMDTVHNEILSTSEEELCSTLKKLAVNDLLDLIDEQKIDRNCVLFYPSIDYFSLQAIISYLEFVEPANSPMFILRWIGVMENVLYDCEEGVDQLCRRLKLLIGRGGRILNACESSVYAEKLSLALGVNVAVSPTLVNEKALPYSHNGLFTINFPGSGRLDKGFNRIATILDFLSRKYPSLDYKAIVQLLPSNELKHYFHVVKELGKNSRVILQPATVSQDEMIVNMKYSDVIVTPYDSNIYKYRSSAIMSESAVFGRPVVASAKCGFSDELVYFGIGKTASSDEEFADCIYSYSQVYNIDKEIYVRQTRARFLQYVKFLYQDLFKDIVT